VRIVSPTGKPFTCGNNIPVKPARSIKEDPKAGIIILPELWLGPDETFSGSYPELTAWLKQQYKQGTVLYSACCGTIMLAESGLLDDCPATSHRGCQDLSTRQCPKVHFQPEPNLLFADPAGGNDLAFHMIARLAGTGEALCIEEAARLLEAGQMPVDDISTEPSYDAPSFFRRLFKRLRGLTPSQYRRMFQPVINAGKQ
jgi:transcriptional regulator GlxA family with amidase domain